MNLKEQIFLILNSQLVQRIWIVRKDLVCLFFYLNVSFKLSPDIHACQAYSEKYFSVLGLTVKDLISCSHIKQTLSFAKQHDLELYQPLCFSEKDSVVCAKLTFLKKKKLNCVFWWLMTNKMSKFCGSV